MSMRGTPPATTIGREQVLHLARLAQLELGDDEAERMTSELGRILGYVELMAEADLAGVEPFVHAPPARLDYRPDEPEPSLPLDKVLAGAPGATDGGFEVPTFVDRDAPETT